jgi:hypothetical protein
MSPSLLSSVMPGLVPGIHAFVAQRVQGVDGRNECGHDASGMCCGFAEGEAC